MSVESLLMAICPLDGRYHEKCNELANISSEYGLIYYRLLIEIRWLQALAESPQITEIPPLSAQSIAHLEDIINNFDEQAATQVKIIESTTNHDVKAVEYFIKDSIKQNKELALLSEFIHFACTSEDINNLAYALMVKDIREKILVPTLSTLTEKLKLLAKKHSQTPMLSRTHGQTASPTTVGKEMANTYYRLQRLVTQFERIELLGKINGAVGNFNAHTIAYPEVDWITLSQSFVHSLGLVWDPLTTQIEPHDYLAEYFDCLARINTVLIDFCRDIWGYISLNYFTQVPVAGEVGSSTMPHKVNPIDFENAEGNLGVANALFNHFSQKLPISRWQRDLSDSTVLRNVGTATGYMLIALKSILRGLSKLEVNTSALKADLNNNWEVLGEAFQTVMRRYGIPEPYEKLKALTRGKRITPDILHEFVDNLALPDPVKKQLKSLTPSDYTGLAAKLVDTIL